MTNSYLAGAGAAKAPRSRPDRSPVTTVDASSNQREFAEPVLERPRLESGERKRPGGVTFLAILNIFGSVVMGFASLGAVYEMSELQDPGATAFYGLFMGTLAVFTIMIVVGLLKLRNWARITAIIIYGVSVLIGLIDLATGNPLGLFQIVVPLIIVVYLNRQHVRQAFGVG